jgi:hypothetical protein
MLSRFDWLRRSRTGAELLATLQYVSGDERQVTGDVSLVTRHSSPATEFDLAPPPSALAGPCVRCWVYPRAATKPVARYCPTCQAILEGAWRVREMSARTIVVWGFVTQLPQQMRGGVDLRETHLTALYVHDDQHFLAMLRYRELQPWLQELALYHGGDLKGLLQVCPTTGGRDLHMGELLCRMVHNEARFPTDRLRIRFFASPHQVYDPQVYDRMGVLTFDVAEFLRMLDMAVVFRTLLPPDEQRILHELLTNEDASQEQFYWGRLLGCLTREAKDMLNAWRIRQWQKPQVDLLYELVEYVGFYQSY